MRQKVPFKSMKITLSEEAVSRLTQLRFKGSLRSDSATIEECVRAIYDISIDLGAEITRTAHRNQDHMPVELQAEALRRILFRIHRFVPISEETVKKLSDLIRAEEPSAGP